MDWLFWGNIGYIKWNIPCMNYSPGTLVHITEQKECIEYFRVVLIYIKLQAIYVSTMA